MAENRLRDSLKRLFSTNVIVRNVGGRSLKIADTQQVQKVAQYHLYGRYAGLHSSLSGYTAQSEARFKQAQRLSLFRDYEAMDQDSIASSALDIYADESTMKSEYGSVLGVKTENDQVKNILNNLFYDILNIEFNLWTWTRNMTKYGDFFLFLDIAEDYGIINVIPLPVYDVIRVEGEDPENPYYVKFALEQADTLHKIHSLLTKKDFENYEIAHFRLLSDSNFLPYGKSMIEGARKVWKQLSLMEDAMLIHRIMRAPEKRIFKIDVGNISPKDVDPYMKKIIDKVKKAPVVDETTGDYNLRYNMQNVTEDFYLPVRGGDSGTSIDTLSGLEYNAIEDIEYLRNKMLAALRVPKAFLGYEEGLGSKATLAAEDVRFARTIERIQRILISELTKIGIIHLYAQGFTDEKLVDFELELTSPSTIYEQEKISLWNEKQSLASSLTDGENPQVSTEWVYDNVFKFTNSEKEKIRAEIVEDQKRKFRYEQIRQEGNDPVKTGKAVGTPADLTQGGGYDQSEENDIGPEGGSEEGGNEGAGRPKEASHYKKDSHVRGRDPLGAHDNKKAGSSNPKYGIALAHYSSLKKTLKQKFKNASKADVKILKETTDIENEYENEINESENSSSLADK